MPQNAVRKAAFAKLQRALNALEKKHTKEKMKPSHLLDAILEILRGFPLQQKNDERTEEIRGGLSTEELTPAIILSESFIAGN